MHAVVHCCRLCHREVEADSPNIFESSLEFCKELSIAEIAQHLWAVHYERHELLPDLVCPECLELLLDAFEQRRGMQEREQALQEQLKELMKTDPKYRPGFNGNPGEFEPEEDCEIVEVDPEKLSETSEDEFLHGSEGDFENYEEDDEEEEEDFDEEDEEEGQNGDDVDMPLGMDAAQMALMEAGMQANNVNAGPNAAGVKPKRAFLCQYCDLGFTLPADCQQHEKSAHDPAAPYCCTFCNLRLTARTALIAHIKSLHDPDRPYVCTQCRKGFVRRSDLKKHTIVHTGVRPYTCNVCSKSFSRNTNLNKHIRIHSGVKPFVCQQCPRSFQTAVELTKHSRSHSELKPYQCGRCPYSFSRKDKLLAHQQIHIKHDIEQQQLGLLTPADGDPAQLHQQQQLQQLQFQAKAKVATQSKSSRNFHCDVCDRSFQRERDLQRHRALHMDSLFACKTCNQGFNRREQLQRHELEAHGPSYTCSICCINFLYQVELENHLKVHQLQHKMAQSAQEAINAAASLPLKKVDQAPVPVIPPVIQPSPAELSFYSNMIPTMNLGFYSETRPEE